jgi:predicted metal-dependent enzyme (double-stranded beta helix superfamily)
MFDLNELLVELQSTLGEATPSLAVRDVLERGVARPRHVAEALAPKAGGIRLLLHRPDLTVIDAAWAPAMRLMPHDHRMWAVIAIYQGAEDNAFYRRGPDGSLVESNGRRLQVSDVIVLGDSTIHAVSNPTGTITGAIHVYGGDFVHHPRSQWGPGDLVERPYDFDVVMSQFDEANVAAGLDRS